MSSGGAAIVPVAVVVAAGAVAAAVVVAAVGAAVLVVNAANQAAEGTVRAVGRRGEELEMLAACRSEAEVNALRWQAAAADVVGLNARLRLVSQRAHRSGVPVDLPLPLDLAGRSREDAIRWAKQAERRVIQAQQALDAAAAESQWRHLTAELSSSSAGRSDTTAALIAYQATLRQRHHVHDGPVPVGTELEEIVRRLDPDATTDEQTRVLWVAAHARAQREQHDADAYRFALQRLVDHDINPKVARRRLAAEWLQALEQPTVSSAIAQADPPTPFSGTAGKLLAVIEGSAELRPQLHTEAKEAVAWAGDVARQAFIRDMVRTCLTDAGYSVEGEFSVKHAVRLRASRSDWHGEHSAELWVDEKGSVEGRLVREYDMAGDDAQARDSARCDDFHTTLQALEAGHECVTVTINPGQKPLLRYRSGDGHDLTTTTQRQLGARTHDQGERH
jgi:hypothetical protein